MTILSKLLFTSFQILLIFKLNQKFTATTEPQCGYYQKLLGLITVIKWLI